MAVAERPVLTIALSFASDDRDVAVALAETLQEHDWRIRVWMTPDKMVTGERWAERVRSELAKADILIPIFTPTTTSQSDSYTGFEVGYFTSVASGATKMSHFPEEDRRIVSLVVATTPSEFGFQPRVDSFIESFQQLRIRFDTSISPNSNEFYEQNESNIELILHFLEYLRDVLDRAHNVTFDEQRLLRTLARKLCQRLFVIVQALHVETHRDVERVREMRSIEEERYSQRNIKDTFIVQSFAWSGISFFEDGQYRLSPRVNVLLGKNGYGKTLLLRTLAALMQRDADHSSLPSAASNIAPRLTVEVTRNGQTEVISRDIIYFRDGVGKIPLLAIPDSRFVNRAQRTVAGATLGSEPLVQSGARHFLAQEPYENVVQDLLTQLCLDYLEASSADRNQRFDRPIFRLVERVVAELTEDDDFRFAHIKRAGTSSFEILVHSAGATRDPIPIQLASQGTLSIVAIFGLIYSFLRTAHPELQEDKVFDAAGIVLIDEVDAHLHPSWQQKLLSMLTATFSNVQFILSAHSPFIVAGCDQGEASVLRRRRETGAFYLDMLSQDFLGASSRDLYRQVFEVDEIDRLYLEYSAKALLDSDQTTREIELLERKQPRLKEEDQRLDGLYRQARLMDRAVKVRDERLRMERRDTRIAMLEAEVERLTYTLQERNAPLEKMTSDRAKS